MSENTTLVHQEAEWRRRWHRVVKAEEEWYALWRELFEVDEALWQLQNRIEAYCRNWPVDPWTDDLYEMMLAGRFDWSAEWERLVAEWHELHDRRDELRQRLRNGGADGQT